MCWPAQGGQRALNNNMHLLQPLGRFTFHAYDLVRASRFCMGGKGAGGSRSKQMSNEANASSGTQCGAPRRIWNLGREQQKSPTVSRCWINPEDGGRVISCSPSRGTGVISFLLASVVDDAWQAGAPLPQFSLPPQDIVWGGSCFQMCLPRLEASLLCVAHSLIKYHHFPPESHMFWEGKIFIVTYISFLQAWWWPLIYLCWSLIYLCWPLIYHKLSSAERSELR